MPRYSFKNIMKKNKTLKKEIKTLKKESEKHNETNSNYSEYMSATGSGDGISSLSDGSVTGSIVSESDIRNAAAAADGDQVDEWDTPTTSESDTLTTATDDYDWNASGSRSRSTGGTRKRHSNRSASRKR